MSHLSIQSLTGYIPFNAFGVTRLNFLLPHCRHVYLHQGQVLFEPGRVQDQAMFLLAGNIRIQHTGQVIRPTFPYALHNLHTPNDTLVAMTDCSLFAIDREILDKLLCWSEVVRYLETDIAMLRQNDDEAAWMHTILQSNLFYKVPPININRIFTHLVPFPVSRGQVVIRQGDLGDCCYFIKKGGAVVTQEMQAGAAPVKLADIGVGRCFGEDALIHETVRNATVTMASDTDSLLMKMEKRDFLQLLREPAVEMIMGSELDMALQSRPVILDVRTLDEYEYLHLKDSMSAPLDILRVRARTLDPQASYIAVCDTDRRSRAASYLLGQLGFRVRALSGGINNLTPVQKQKLVVSS